MKRLLLSMALSCQALISATLIDPYTDGQNQFSWQLMQAINETPSGQPSSNICFSPYNISSALQLAYFGAEGSTRTELGETLHLPMMAVNSLVLKIKEIEQSLGANVINARAIAVDESFAPSEPYLAIARDQLGSTLFSVDCRKNSKGAVEAINKWASDQTHKHIQKLLEPQDIKPTTRLVLLSAIYLKSAWATPFNEKQTKEAPFKTDAAPDLKVSMMHQTERMQLYQDKEVQVVVRECEVEKNSQAALDVVIVLPREDVPIQKVYKNFSVETVGKWVTAARRLDVELFLPRCSVRQRMSLKKSLVALGMKQPFTNGANFSFLSPGLELAIDDVIHEAYMQLDEAGVEAAAATAVTMRMTSVMPQEKHPVVVRCDRPFFVVIRDRSSGLVLFVSLVANPQKIVKIN